MNAVHLVASLPLARSVIQMHGADTVSFADPTTLHGPGGHLSRNDARAARAGLAAVVGQVLSAGTHCTDDMLDAALIGTTVVLGWPQDGPRPDAELRPGAVGPFVAVPRRRPESVMITHVSPIGTADSANAQQILPAPGDPEFFALARAALRTHTLHPGDLITIFPDDPPVADRSPMDAGSWIRVSAPGLGTLSLAVL